MPDRVDTGMQSVQPRQPQLTIDRVLAHPHCQQLPARDDTVLSTGEVGGPRVQATKLPFPPLNGGNGSLALRCIAASPHPSSLIGIGARVVRGV